MKTRKCFGKKKEGRWNLYFTILQHVLKGSVTHTITVNKDRDTWRHTGKKPKPNMNYFPLKLNIYEDMYQGSPRQHPELNTLLRLSPPFPHNPCTIQVKVQVWRLKQEEGNSLSVK